MAIKIRGFRSIGNAGSGMFVSGDVELDAEDIYTEANGMDGLTIIQPQTLVEKLGLPKEVDPKQLGELLSQIQNKNEFEAKEIISNSSFLTKLAGTANLADIASLVFAISTNPDVHKIIERLLS